MLKRDVIGCQCCPGMRLWMRRVCHDEIIFWYCINIHILKPFFPKLFAFLLSLFVSLRESLQISLPQFSLLKPHYGSLLQIPNSLSLRTAAFGIFFYKLFLLLPRLSVCDMPHLAGFVVSTTSLHQENKPHSKTVLSYLISNKNDTLSFRGRLHSNNIVFFPDRDFTFQKHRIILLKEENTFLKTISHKNFSFVRIIWTRQLENRFKHQACKNVYQLQ